MNLASGTILKQFGNRFIDFGAHVIWAPKLKICIHIKNTSNVMVTQRFANRPHQGCASGPYEGNHNLWCTRATLVTRSRVGDHHPKQFSRTVPDHILSS